MRRAGGWIGRIVPTDADRVRCAGGGSTRGGSGGIPREPAGGEMNGAPLPADGYRAVLVGICVFAGLGPLRSVLICDDRPAARQGLSELLRPLPSLLETRCVSDGFAALDALTAEPVHLVLIGVHPASHTGQDAIGLVLGMHPSTVIIVVGSAADIDVLAPAYIGGPRGLLLWEPPAPPRN